MTSFFVGIALSFFLQDPGQTTTQQRKGQPQSIDGDWTVVYVEVDGKKQEMKSYNNVKISNNVVTCNHDGKEKSWKLEFGPHHMVRSTEIDSNRDSRTQNTSDKSGYTHHGVYIAGQDYLCISCMKGRDQRTISSDGKLRQQANQGQDVVQTGGQSGTDGWQSQYPVGSEFVLILRRSGATDR